MINIALIAILVLLVFGWVGWKVVISIPHMLFNLQVGIAVTAYFLLYPLLDFNEPGETVPANTNTKIEEGATRIFLPLLGGIIVSAAIWAAGLIWDHQKSVTALKWFWVALCLKVVLSCLHSAFFFKSTALNERPLNKKRYKVIKKV